MARLNSFYLAPEDWNPPFVLEGGEARHLSKVLRARPGETVRLFDGCGRDGHFEIAEVSKSRVLLKLSDEKIHTDRRGLTLAIGWNKSSRRNWILEKSVELEANGLIFFQSEFTQGKVPGEIKETWTEKLVSAAKQCGNPWLPELSTVTRSVENLIDATDHFSNKLILWENATKGEIPENKLLAQDSTVAVIGPEGGFSLREAELLMENGFKPCSLGGSILRWETAALLCLGTAYLERQKSGI